MAKIQRPAGLVTVDDYEVLPMSQESFRAAAENEEATVLMGRGGRVNTDERSLATERLIRVYIVQ